tara:strand:+ start:999 stop:2504 length:1506 start_codon:yes stop_codon:yes gene_type:complete
MALTKIGTDGVKDDAITSGKIPANAVGSSELADNAVDTAAIADDAVTTAKIAAGNVTATELGTNAVTSAKLAAGAVSEASKIADSIITGAKIGSGAIAAGNLATNSITTAKITDGNVTTSKLADQSVTLAKLPHGTSSNNGKFLRANNGADPTFESLPSSGVTVSNNVNNRVVTGDGTNLNAEANLTFDGTTLQLGGATADSNDVDGSNTKFTIKQSANNTEDGIYIERSGERRGFYIHIGGALGVSDGLGIVSNQNGTETAVLAIDRGGDITIGAGNVTPNATHTYSLGSSSKFWHSVYGKLAVFTHSQGTYSESSLSGNYHQFNVNEAGDWCVQMRNHAAGYGLDIEVNSDSSSRLGLNIRSTNDDQDKAGIKMNGGFVSRVDDYASYSDIKLKENIVDAKSQWNDIKAIKFRNFNFKTNPDQKLLGVVAQEIESICPNLVEDMPDMERDSETGELKESGTVTKTVKSSVLRMKGLKALQEAMARIEALEAEVAALKAG